jgi:hypothetical protein
MTNNKKLLGFAIEKQSQHMIALSPKMNISANDDCIVSLKLRAIGLKQTKFHYIH